MIRRQPLFYQCRIRCCLAFCLLLAILPILIGCSPAESTLPTPTPDPVLIAGQKVFVAHCGACHSTTAGTVIVGPSLAGIGQTGATRVDGLDARTYIYSSVMQPDDYIVSGFENLMPKDLAKKLTGEELDSVVAYVLSLE